LINLRRNKSPAEYDLRTMTYYRRVRTGYTFFFTLVSFNRRRILCDPAIRDALRRAIGDVRTLRPFSIDGWVLLPDHLHCIWTLPEGDSDFSTRWSLIKRSVSRFTGHVALDANGHNASKRKHRESTIWQRRFWEHLIRDDVDFERHLDYIHYNPVRHGYVSRVTDWKYSTFHRYASAGVYPRDWGGGPTPEWGDFE
jgi:putative transposase